MFKTLVLRAKRFFRNFNVGDSFNHICSYHLKERYCDVTDFGLNRHARHGDIFISRKQSHHVDGQIYEVKEYKFHHHKVVPVDDCVLFVVTNDGGEFVELIAFGKWKLEHPEHLTMMFCGGTFVFTKPILLSKE